MGVSFETYLRRRGDVLMRRRHYVPLRRGHDIPIRRREDVPLRRLDDVPLRRHYVFHLRRTYDLAGTYKKTSLRRRHEVLLPVGNWYLLALVQIIAQYVLYQVFLKFLRNSFICN